MRTTLFLLAALCACGDTGQPRIRYRAEALAAPVVALSAGDWTVTLDSAEVAFGPLYLCAAASGSATLCDTAVGELRSVHRLDLLALGAQPLGTIEGLASEVRSASFDYGIHWLLTEAGPRVAAAAPGGHSAMFTGAAARDGETLRFEAVVDVVASYQGQRAVPSVAAAGVADETTTRLELGFELPRWIGALDFDEVAALTGDPKRIEPGSALHNALVLAMSVNAPPAFHWIHEP